MGEHRHLLLVNPAAGAGRAGRLLQDTRAALERAGIEHRLVTTRGIEHGVEEARAAAAAGERVLVMSGDGLIGHVGGALAEGDGVMGILPGGRGNDLARVLGIPSDPVVAALELAAYEVVRIDVGEANGRRFLCIASCGFDSVANEIANRTRALRGRLVYAYAALRALVGWRPARFTLTLDGQRVELRGYSVAAANSRAYGGGMLIAPEADLTDGMVDVIAVGEGGKLAFLRGLPQVFRGAHLQREEVRSWRVRELRIEADRPFTVFADGDPLTELPATVRVIPRALNVLVPPGVVGSPALRSASVQSSGT
jgi:YegS/Rv2252/BmrU family lipid kinase